MKWITIEKAKPVFDKDYLATNGGAPGVVRLKSSQVTATGVSHTWQLRDGSEVDSSKPVTHICLITLPNEKEVGNG